jgi:hypothetical protein
MGLPRPLPPTHADCAVAPNLGSHDGETAAWERAYSPVRSTLTLLPLHTRPVRRAVRCNAACCPIRAGLDVRSEGPRYLQVTWESLVYSDGSIYQGLAQQGKAQGRGGLLYANGDSYVPCAFIC